MDEVHAVAAIGRYNMRLGMPGRRYWASVVMTPDSAPVLKDCGHKHRHFEGAVLCALATGPSAMVIRWTRHGIESYCDADTAAYLAGCEDAKRGTEEGEGAAKLAKDWCDQRIASVTADGWITFRDTSNIGESTDGKMVH